jgi:hypothetical protein
LLVFYKTDVSEDSDTADVAPYPGENSATTKYFTFQITNFQLHSKT